MTTAIILSIGDELVLGQTVDTNSAWLSQQLAAIGVRIVGHATAPDDQPSIEDAIRTAAARCEILLISGGLGPTEDDLTRQALAAVLGVPLEMNDAALKKLTAFFRLLNREMAESNKMQAMIPRGAQMIENTCGTAPGIRAVFDHSMIANAMVDDLYFRAVTDSKDRKSQTANLKCDVFAVPGVPKEMKAMFTLGVLPALKDAGGGAAIVSRTLHTFGLGESNVGELLGDLMQRGRNPSVGTTVSGGVVSIRVNSYFESREKASEELEKSISAVRKKLGDLIYGDEDETIPQAVANLLKAAPDHPTVTTAESCTGGLLAKMLTDLAGSSSYFNEGWVTYSNQAKEQLLGVDAELLREHGAVSEPVALAMSAGARDRSDSTYALSITGIAGPDGGTPAKPVGTVCISLATPTEASVRTFRFSGDREFVRDRSAKMALTMLRFYLLGKRLPF